MKCKQCGTELPDLTMYCTNCGAKQFGRREEDVELIMPDVKKSRIIVDTVDNMTKALSRIRELTGMTIQQVNAILKDLPGELLGGLDEESAKDIARVLEEGGVHVHIEGRKPAPEAVIAEMEETAVNVEEEPVPEPVPEPAVEPEVIPAPVYEPEEIPVPAEEPEVVPEPAEEPEEMPEIVPEPEKIPEPEMIPEPEEAPEPADEPEVVPVPAEEPAEEDDSSIQLTIEPTTFEGIAAEIELIDESMKFDKEKPAEITLSGLEPKVPGTAEKKDQWSDFEEEMKNFMKKDEE